MELQQQILDVLAQEFPGSEVYIQFNPDTDRVGGRVVWEGFQGKRSITRQARIFNPLRKALSPEVVHRNVSFIFTYTPDEYRLSQEV